MNAPFLHVDSPYNEEQVRAYLRRIDFPGCELGSAAPFPPPTLATLALLQRCHLVACPFENTFIHYESKADGRPHIDPQSLFERIVLKRLGGYCYLQNSLFRDMLRALGFRCYTGCARVNPNPAGFTLSPITHMTIFVSMPSSTSLDGYEIFLVDVGFGKNCLVRPMPMRYPGARIQGATRSEQHCLSRKILPGTGRGKEIWSLDMMSEGSDTPAFLYTFDEEELFPEDYEVLCFAVAHQPRSLFTSHLLLCKFYTLAGASVGHEEVELGKWTGMDWNVKRYAEAGAEDLGAGFQIQEGDHAHRKAVLRELFGIAIE